jgi:hypothetical protein
VPRSKWREAAAYGDYLAAKQKEFHKVPVLELRAVFCAPQAVEQRAWTAPRVDDATYKVAIVTTVWQFEEQRRHGTTLVRFLSWCLMVTVSV